jgi:hypothetical protein
MGSLDKIISGSSTITYMQGHFKKFPHCILKNLIYVRDIKNTLLFNIIFLLLNTFSPAVCKLVNII